MKKARRKPLALATETIRSLRHHELRDLVAGADTDACSVTVCVGACDPSLGQASCKCR
jgi:hypothetical protein